MEEYPGAAISLSQPVYALEKRVSLMVNRSFSDAILHEEIDWVVPKLSSISASVRQLKNSLAPINRLPQEVLALIQTFRESEQDLISATAVCRYWRRVLISTPSLWTNIICTEQENPGVTASHVQTYIERCGSIPVKVQIHACSSRVLSSHIERVSSLRMFLDHPSNLDEMAEHLSKPAPLLETATLCVRDRGSYQPVLVLPPSFFEACLSSVRTLTLQGATLSPGSCNLSQLTKFTLETNFVTSVPSVVLLDALERMPLLRLFKTELYYAMPPTAIPENRVVTLPYLEDITITTDEHPLTPFTSPILPVLRLPSAHRITMRSTNTSGTHSTPILPLSFEERLPSLRATPEVSVTLGRGFDIEFFGLDQSKLALSVGSVTPFLFTRSMFGGAPFDSVRKLHVGFPSSTVNVESFIAILRAMRRLEYLEMEQNTVVPLAHWIDWEERDPAGTCPALITLTVIEANLDEATRRVQRFKEVRIRAGVPIARVEIRYGWNYYTDDMNYPPSTLSDV